MSSVELEDQEWQSVISIIATAPWRDANPLLMKISSQLQQQANIVPGKQKNADGKEVSHG
jgi:hypothetical protein